MQFLERSLLHSNVIMNFVAMMQLQISHKQSLSQALRGPGSTVTWIPLSLPFALVSTSQDQPLPFEEAAPKFS
jgi:hypothetical protein